jgi:hypothetical protein
MERKGQEPSGGPPQVAEGEGRHISEQKRVIMAVTQMLDSGTLDGRSLRLLEQLADSIQCPQAKTTREAEPTSRRLHGRLRPQEGSQ